MPSLRARLGVAFGAVAVGSVVLTALLSLGLLRASTLRTARADLARVAQALSEDPDFVNARGAARPVIRRLLTISGEEVAAVLANGRVIGDGAHDAASIDTAPLLSGRSIEGTSSGLVYAGVPMSFPNLRGLILLRPVKVARGVFATALGFMLIAALVTVGAAALVSTFLVKRLTRPLEHLSRAATEIARGDLAQQVPVESDDELGGLALAFNGMTTSLREAQRREREFIASVSHELRTPVTAIRGYAEALEDGAVRDDHGRAEAIRIIRTESVRLERMVSDVMDLARIGAREFTLDVVEADLTAVLGDAIAAHRAEATQAGVALGADLADGLVLRTDPDRVRQIVSNLVQNALRVTASGGTVVVRARSEADHVVIEVADTGPGIAREDLPHVFERSYLWRASKEKQSVGTGLGLAIVRELVSVLGGTVEVATELGRGTTFIVSLSSR